MKSTLESLVNVGHLQIMGLDLPSEKDVLVSKRRNVNEANEVTVLQDRGGLQYNKNHGFSRLSDIQVDYCSIHHSNASSLGIVFYSRYAFGIERE